MVASNSGFKTKREAEIEALPLELKLIDGAKIHYLIGIAIRWVREVGSSKWEVGKQEVDEWNKEWKDKFNPV